MRGCWNGFHHRFNSTSMGLYTANRTRTIHCQTGSTQQYTSHIGVCAELPLPWWLIIYLLKESNHGVLPSPFALGHQKDASLLGEPSILSFYQKKWNSTPLPWTRTHANYSWMPGPECSPPCSSHRNLAQACEDGRKLAIHKVGKAWEC